jgi:YidC/Oxa1 family membrane protein insertase
MPPGNAQKKNTVLQFLVTFAIVYLVTSMGLRILFPERFGGKQLEKTSVIMSAETRKVTMGRDYAVSIQNLTENPIALQDRCPEPPLIIERKVGDKLYQLDLLEPVVECESLTKFPAEETTRIDLSPWKYAAFSEPGTYRISIPEEALVAAEIEPTEMSIEIRVKKPGVFTSMFRAFISKPLFNGLILIASLLPAHSLGWSIIILTLLVKLLLFFPSQHALESQKKLQAIQPKIEEIKKKYKGDQQRITEETMVLWRKEKINPLQSCLPTLLQLPVLLGLFFIIKDSGSIELAKHLLYPPFMNLDWTFATEFVGILDLKGVPYAGATFFPSLTNLKIVFFGAPVPLAIALMQFFQMKMVFAAKDKKDDKKKEKKPLAERLDTQTMMMYMLPVMIFFISGSLPNAVSLYWGASTIFSIGQQMVVNKK